MKFSGCKPGLRRGLAQTGVVIVGTALMAGCGGGGQNNAQTAAALAAIAAAQPGASPPQGTPAVPSLTCDDSIKTNFKPDAQTSVLLVKAFKKGDALPNPPMDGVAVVGEDLCLIKLLVGPGNAGPVGAPSTSSGIGIEVWLPVKAAWNGRLYALGGGGWAGTEETNIAKISSVTLSSDFRSAPTIAAGEGAVTATSDTGHTSKTPGVDGSFAMNADGTINKALWVDFASRGIHEQVVKAKQLAAAYYGKAPTRTYWDGGSTGGRQALKQAQAYPEDFEGIISGYPAINWTRFITAELYPQIVIQRDLGGAYMTPAQLTLVSNAATGACDVVGGKHLGYLIDPATCRYDPTKDVNVLCISSGGTNNTAACVNLVQANAINKMWYGMTADGSVPDPAVDNGWALQPTGTQRWYGLTRGTNLLALASPVAFSISTDQVALELQNPTLAGPTFLNSTGNGADGWKGLSYGALSNAFDRGIALQEAFGNINTDNPDLTAFKARGGKLIQYHGLADTVIFPQGSMNYYERVASSMGGRESLQSFYKLYFVPGMGHGPNNGMSNPDANPPLPFTGQIFRLMTDWVENGIEPEGVVVTSSSDASPAKSQPICPYPKKATYDGISDSFVASSYKCS